MHTALIESMFLELLTDNVDELERSSCLYNYTVYVNE